MQRLAELVSSNGRHQHQHLLTLMYASKEAWWGEIQVVFSGLVCWQNHSVVLLAWCM
jgi:hypothetical protein